MSIVLATYNVKGGVGKTSAAVNLAYPAARGGAQTLLRDLDPPGAYARRGGAALAYETLWGDVRRRLAEYPSRPA